MNRAPIRVVVADDTADLREALVEQLVTSGRFLVVGEANDGRAAVDLAAVEQPDLMLLDLSMPVMDGLEAIPLILKRSPRTRIAVLSGLHATLMRGDALRSGAHLYIEKGIPAETLVEQLIRLCAAA
jgi:DNA-binding NarL/FixJ family response regulator